jgi:hypothetical protein
MPRTFFFLFLLSSLTANAQFYTGPRAAAMGGAGRASIETSESAFLNPALLAHADHNYLSLFKDSETREPKYDTDQWGLSVVDAGADTGIPGSFSYSHKNIATASGNEVRAKDYELSLARRWNQAWAFGMTLYRQQWNDTENLTEHGLHLGAIYYPTPFFGLGAVIYQAVKTGDLKTPAVYALGSHYVVGNILKLSADVRYVDELNPDKKWDFMGGAAIPIGDEFYLRGGYEWISLEKRQFYSAGFSWDGPRLNIAYAYQNNPSSGGERMHNLDLSVFF